MMLYLFFGGFHDTLKDLFGQNHILTRYVFLLPFLTILVITLLLIVNKAKSILIKVVRYANLMFIVFLLIDIPTWNDSLKKQPTTSFTFLPVEKKPDVYLIIADEYADSASLQQAFQFNNGKFLKELRDRGFGIIESKSNYNFTPFCVSSLLSMNYLTNLERSNSSIKDMQITSGIILKNPLVNFFRFNGYDVKNFSIFNFADIPSPLPAGKREVGIRYIQQQTLFSRLEKDLAYHFVLRFPKSSFAKKWTYYDNARNNKNLELLRNEIGLKSRKPRFIYTHLLLPHYPYYFDSSGKPYPVESLGEKESTNKRHYLQYLEYGNKIFIQLIDAILSQSNEPPIIILMGDHGFREFEIATEPNHLWFYMNHNSIYLPGRNYDKFYRGISSVNQFRTVLNSSFSQNLPILPDSTIFIRE